MKSLTALTAALALSAGAALADNPVVLKAVGTWSSLTNYQKHEGPFFNERLAEASGGQIVGEIQSQSGLGLKGFEIMRLVKNGVFDFAFGLPGYVAAENAIFEGADLSSVTQDIDTQRKVAEAYFPTLEEAFAQYYNAKLLMLYPFPSQTLWCNAEVNGIQDLEGKKIRVYATTLGDFVEGAGGTSVTVPFSEVIPALEKGVVDCGITGTMSAYTANWQQVATHAYTLRVGWGLAFGAMNMDKWNSMSPEQQELMQTEIAALNERMWAETATEDGIAISCITGGDCEIGEKGGMKLVEPSAEDLAIRDKIASEVVLARWAERCGEDCAENWNNTVGKVLGMTAKAN
ncbi:TRAP transporter substrate-binding protein [Leisingera sp. SS27]|uniref:TRAP transporter substrate-binding protein n=1 Tax=Leisingera sp. SS27 TaxID=2979462 RepID=UPI00232C0EAB|nr:TRAP transporter substrate-binding protein [Leisingera sp. SS27]MDC0659698.1 TRAP transporter substrate-binding protein [Leisingera sp. SS27]